MTLHHDMLIYQHLQLRNLAYCYTGECTLSISRYQISAGSDKRFVKQTLTLPGLGHFLQSDEGNVTLQGNDSCFYSTT